MDGELLMKGYKFSNKLMLNLQDKTIVTGSDGFIAYEMFNMIERYFNRKNFSEHYLDQGTVLILNGNRLSGGEFVVFRIPPIVNLAEELKISKKSIIGQGLQAVFCDEEEQMIKLLTSIEVNLLRPMNETMAGYGISYNCEGADFFTLAKILYPVVREKNGDELLLQEQDQFYSKAMLIDFIARLKTDKKKLLLLEMPEYGVREELLPELFRLVANASIDNSIIYTMRKEVTVTIGQVYNYHVIKNGKIYGFDDYDRLEKQLQEIFMTKEREELETMVLKYIFQRSEMIQETEKMTVVMNEFLK